MSKFFLTLFFGVMLLAANSQAATSSANSPSPGFSASLTVNDTKVSYMLSSSELKIYRWSTTTSSFIAPLYVGNNQEAPQQMLAVPTQNRLYLAYPAGRITYIDLATGTERAFATLPLTVIRSLSSTGKNLFVVGDGYYPANAYMLSSTGAQVDSTYIYDLQYWGGVYSFWDSSKSRFIVTNSYGMSFAPVDPSNGKFLLKTIFGNYSWSSGTASLSADGNSIAYTSGNVKKSLSDSTSNFLGFYPTSIKWLADGTLLTTEVVGGQTTLRRFDSNLRLIDQKQVLGTPLDIIGTGPKYTVLLTQNNSFRAETYQPSNDSDKDGVVNELDAFPTDPAASKDSDNDGYPDAWNPGKKQSDSTTGLTLDTFPTNAGCYIPNQTLNGKCNPATQKPASYIYMTFSNGSIVYLYSPDNRLIYRWDIATSAYLPPLVVGLPIGIGQKVTPQSFTTNGANVLAGYPNGVITVNATTSSISTVERIFATTGDEIYGLSQASNLIVVSTWSGNELLINDQGKVLDSKRTNFPIRNASFDARTKRLYATNSLSFQQIDTTNGKIGATTDIRLPDSPLISAVSTDFKYALSAYGDIFDITNRSLTASLGKSFDAALWLPANSLVTAKAKPQGGSLITRYTNLNTISETLSVPGYTNAIYGNTATKLALVSDENGVTTVRAYTPSNDSDGDGVPNDTDAFPFDAAASVDSDRDGFPDRWNPGKTQANSTSGLTLDAFPQDPGCNATAQGVNGTCNYNLTSGSALPDQTITDGNIVYLLSKTQKRIHRWSITNGAYLSPLVIGYDKFAQDISPQAITYSAYKNRIYISNSNNRISYIDLANTNAERTFATVSASDSKVKQIAAAGKFLLAIRTYSSNSNVFDSNGRITQTLSWSYSRNYVWDNINARMYFFNDASSQNTLQFESINQTTGLSNSFSDTGSNITIKSPLITLSPDSKKVLLGNGDVYSTLENTWSRQQLAHNAAIWLPNGELVLLIEQNNNTRLQRLDITNKVVEERTFNGSPLAIYGTAQKMVVMVNTNNALVNYTYIPTNDLDNDGVANELDAFPNDPAASIDSDLDGHPDSWNPGRSQANSTTGLVLDAFPQDSACYLASQGTGNLCNYASALPSSFTPDQTAEDDTYIYLLSSANRRVFRWSKLTDSYANPLIIGDAFGGETPRFMAVPTAHRRIYLGYSSGKITAIDSISPNREQFFSQTAVDLSGLAAVGNYLLAQERSGSSWALHYIFDQSGAITDIKNWSHYSRIYTWDAINSRVYFFRDNTYPNDLHYETIDQTNGKISTTGETPYHAEVNATPPIRVSQDGTKILLGSGEIYKQADLRKDTPLSHTLTDAKWLSANLLATIEQQNGSTLLKRSGEGKNWVEQLTYQGTPLGIFGNDTKMTIVTLKDGLPAFYTYTPNNDMDGDGVANDQDAFPMDPSASADSDQDGYPDTWNPGKTQVDSTQSLQLDAYPTDADCQTTGQGDGANCDYNLSTPHFVPDQVIDNQGIIYLLSKANKRIYRWNTQTSSYLKPFVVGNFKWGENTTPDRMLINTVQSRLYLYSTGKSDVYYIDLLSDTSNQVFFTSIDENFTLINAGKYILGLATYSSWTSYLVDSQAVKTPAYLGYNYSNKIWSWNNNTSSLLGVSSFGEFSSIYIAQSGTPSAQTTSYRQLSGWPYFVTAYFSKNGGKLLTSTGTIYSTEDSTSYYMPIAGTLNQTVAHSTWTDHFLVTINNTGDLKVWDAVTYALIRTQHFDGTPISLSAMADKVTLVSTVNGNLTFNNIGLGDEDGDGLPQWWELTYGLNDNDPTDASVDSDGDSLTNLQEFNAGTNPTQADSDNDGLNDGLEVNTYHTNPNKADSDGDKLNDYEEVTNYSTNPLSGDTDGDTYSDFEEVSIYHTDPLDAQSAPTAITIMDESFEGQIPFNWVANENSNSNWKIDSTSAYDGTASLKSGIIGNSLRSNIAFNGNFAQGTLHFRAKVDAESCCDILLFYVDNTVVSASSNTWGQWTEITIPISNGKHTLTWEYRKDSSVASGADAVWIDKVTFVSP